VVIAALDGGNKSFRLSQEILKQDGSVAIDALVTSIVMRMDTHETIEIPPAIRSFLPPRQD
jgi:acyl-CoA thioesterase FadM